MGKKLTDEFLKWTLDVDGKPAMAALNGMEQQTRLLQKANQGLFNEMAKLEAQGKKNSDEYKQLDKQYKINNQTIKQSETRMSELRKEIGLNGLSANQLSKRMNELKRAVNDAVPNSAAWKQHKKELAEVTARYNQVKGAAGATHSVFGQLKGLLPAMGVAGLVAGLGALFGKITGVRGEFEKYAAVLKNAFGSQRTATKEMDMLVQFAAETPFQLNELTGAYVKLVNYGLKPTKQELVNYGDLASSVGKGFDQLVEGIADAVTGEYERLKEFGVKAKVAGDKVTFTFKEQSTTVDNTAASIKNYILGLGELEGVAGSMNAILKTQIGATSNLSDSIGRLFNKIGSGALGEYYVNLVRMATGFIDSLTGKSKTYREDLESTTASLNSELQVLRAGNFTADERKKMIQGINKEYKEYLPYLLDENATLKQIEGFQNKINQHLQARIIYAAYEEEITAILKKQKDSLESNYKIEKKRTELKFGQDKSLRDSPFADQQSKILGTIETVNDAIIQSTGAAVDETKNKYDSMGKAIGLTFAQIEDIVNKVKTPKIQPHKVTDKELKTAEKKALEDAEAENKKQIDIINKRHIDTKNSEAVYQAELSAQDSAFLRKKMSIYKEGSKEYEDIVATLSTNQVKQEQVVKELLLQAQKELTDAKIENLKDGIDKEKAIEEQRWADELAGLKKRSADIIGISADEIAAKDAINKIIEEKTTAHNTVITDLNTASALEAQMDTALFDEAKAKTDQEKFAAARELEQAQYDQELTDAKGNAKKIELAEQRHSNALIQIKKDEKERRLEVQGAVLNAAEGAFGALVELVGKETALGKALFAFQQAAAIGQILINTAVANSAALKMGPAAPFIIAFDWVVAAASIASVVAQTAATFSGKGGKGKQSGGYADSSSSDSDPAGVYHANEFIASAPAVRNPTVKPILDIIDIAQRTGTIKNLNLAGVLSGGRQAGGYAGGSGSSASPTIIQMPGSDPEMKAAIQELNRNLKKGIKANVNKYGTNSLSEALADIAAFQSKIYQK